MWLPVTLRNLKLPTVLAATELPKMHETIDDLNARCGTLENTLEEFNTELTLRCNTLGDTCKTIVETTQEMTSSIVTEVASRLDTLNSMVAHLETRLNNLEQGGDSVIPTAEANVFFECDAEVCLDNQTPLDDEVLPSDDEEHPCGRAEDMESDDISDDEFKLPTTIQGNVFSNVRVHGPSKVLLSELQAKSVDEEFAVHPNEDYACGSNNYGFGALALPKLTVKRLDKNNMPNDIMIYKRDTTLAQARERPKKAPPLTRMPGFSAKLSERVEFESELEELHVKSMRPSGHHNEYSKDDFVKHVHSHETVQGLISKSALGVIPTNSALNGVAPPGSVFGTSAAIAIEDPH
jgi:hypothetical protein